MRLSVVKLDRTYTEGIYRPKKLYGNINKKSDLFQASHAHEL